MRQRKLSLAVLMTTLCLLCACASGGSEPLQTPMDHRTALLAGGGCVFELEARVDAGDLLWELTLSCVLNPSGDGTVTVLAPESIAGICAVCEDGAASLRYEDLALGLGTLDGAELAPALIPGRLARAWAQAWIASAGEEEDAVLACYEDGSLSLRTWFDGEHTPTRVEVAVDGQVRLTGEIKSFSYRAP